MGLTLVPYSHPYHANTVTDKFTESVYVLANEPSVALYRLQEHVRRSLPELAQHKVSAAGPAEVSPGPLTLPEREWGAIHRGAEVKRETLARWTVAAESGGRCGDSP